MSHPAAPDRAGFAHRNGDVRALNSGEIDAILADFRHWLEAHGRAAAAPAERLDLAALLGHFTALRHEVNLQTKASRTLADHASKLLETSDGAPKPVVKAFLDLADVLAVSITQMEKLRETVEPLLEHLASEPLPPMPTSVPGFLAKLFGASHREWQQWADDVRVQHEARCEASAAAAETLLDLAQAAADGYAMTLRRVERALPDLELEPIECVGLPFDPETMEVVEVSGEGAAGIVADEVRRGYRCRGSIIRFAQVRVAR